MVDEELYTEIEVKLLGIDILDVERRVQKVGATKTFEGLIRTAYYDFPDYSLHAQHKMLRLREKEDARTAERRAEVTLKERLAIADTKIMKELETTLGDADRFRAILHGLGLRVSSETEKQRISYALEDERQGKVHFDLDTYTGIPPLLEVEAPTAEMVRLYVERLGFSWADAKPWDVGDVLRHYEREVRGEEK